MNNSWVHVNMTGEWNILIFTTIAVLFHLTNSQPSILNLTLQNQCRTDNGSQIRLNNLNDSGSQTELLIGPMWSSVDGNYTPWIAYIGCFEIKNIPVRHRQHQAIIRNNTVEGCYLECQKWNSSCGQNEPVYSALKGFLCFCFCQIQQLILPSNKCNASCSRSPVSCSTDNYFYVYTECSKSDMVKQNVYWEEANERCKSQNDSLVSIQDIKNHHSLMVGHSSIWSSVKGTFTPWIAYRGCYEGGLCGGNQCYSLVNNTVGNCYFECKSKTNYEGGCAGTEQFYFGLQMGLCICFCNTTKLSSISESAKCNLSCAHGLNNGECGGVTFYSLYEVMTATMPNTSFGGFCLTCQMKNGSIDLSSMECDATANGYCVVSNNNTTPMDIMMSTFNAYWNRCKKRKLYIVGNKEYICQNRGITIWTGLRKYEIELVKSDRICYSIEKNDDILSYRERHCTERLPFICKQHIDRDDYRTTTTVVIAESSTHTTTNDTLVIIFSVCGTIIAVCVMIFLLYCRVLRMRCPLHATSHVYQDRIKKTIYLNTSGESGSKTDSDLQNVYHTIVPDNGNDHFYDQIHKSERENDQQYVIIQ